MKHIKTIIILLISGFVLGVGSFAIYFFMNPDMFSSLDRSEILKNILANNPQFALNPFSSRNSATEASLDQAAGAKEESLAIAAPSYWSDVKDYSYSYSSTVTTPGPKADSCPALFIPSEKQTAEYYDYWGDEGYFFKSVLMNADDEIRYYSLDMDGASYQYNGGEYAVKILSLYSPIVYSDTGLLQETTDEVNLKEASEEIYIEEPIDSVEADVIEDNAVYDYFGEDVEVEEVTENGVAYYVTTWKYQTNCDMDYLMRTVSVDVDYAKDVAVGVAEEESGDLETIIIKSWVRAEDYQMVKEETYIGSVAAANLVATYEMDLITSNDSFAAVADEFSFDLDVPVREIEWTDDYVDPYSDMEAYITKASDFMVGKSMVVPFVGSELGLTYAYFNFEYDSLDDRYSYLIDRDFYSTDEEGQQQYEDALESYWIKPGSNALATFDFANEDYSKSLTAAVFEGYITEDEILENYAYASDMDSVSKSVRINGGNATVTAYYYDMDSVRTFDVEEVSVSEGSAGSSEPGYAGDDEKLEFAESDYKFVQMYAVLDMGDFKYLLTYYSNTEGIEDAAFPSLVTYNITDAGELNTVLTAIRVAYEDMGGREEPMPVDDVETVEE